MAWSVAINNVVAITSSLVPVTPRLPVNPSKIFRLPYVVPATLLEMVTSRLLVLKITSSPAAGNAPVDQLVVVFQSPSVVPVHETTAMCIPSAQSGWMNLASPWPVAVMFTVISPKTLKMN